VLEVTWASSDLKQVYGFASQISKQEASIKIPFGGD